MPGVALEQGKWDAALSDQGLYADPCKGEWSAVLCSGGLAAALSRGWSVSAPFEYWLTPWF